MHNPFTSRSIVKSAGATGFAGPLLDENDGQGHEPLWWAQRFMMPFMSFQVFNNTPYWQTLINMEALFDWYATNPVFYATVMIKAREYANMHIKVVNRSTGAIEDERTQKVIPRKLYDLFNNPNVLQSRWEFFMQRKIFEEVAGNSFTYGNSTIGFEPNIRTMAALWNVWPAYMQYKLGSMYFEATRIDEIIKGWKFELGQYKKEWNPNEILHKNKPNVNPKKGLIFGQSTAEALTRPLSNIDMAYEARNVIMRNRGMRAIVSSDKKDASANLSLLPDEMDAVEKKFKKYGLLQGQMPFMFSEYPLRVSTIDQDVTKLGLFEEIATDAMMVCNAFGVPEILLKLYIKGSTFENQEASVRRLYQGTLIPEADDDMIALNNFLKMADTEWFFIASFDHVAALQESEERRQRIHNMMVESLLKELAAGTITMQEYRIATGRGPLPAA